MKVFCSFAIGLALLLARPVAAADQPEISIQDLPTPVQTQLLELFGGETPAGSASPYNDSDLITPGLPRRRILFVATQGDLYLVHYAHGGYSWHTHLVGIRHNRSGTTPALNVSFYESFASLADAKASLSALKFGSPEIGWAGESGSRRLEY